MGRQFVVQLDNRPGELAHLARALASRGIDITHISCAGTGSIACAFLTTGHEDQTRQVLHGLGHEYIEGSTVVVDVMDEPGGLAEVTERFARAGVNILGVLPVGRRGGVVEMAFAVDDEERARGALVTAELAGGG
ncbi:MAG TPA: ACT domain-containing protein [Candidatus Dormibacteraeota bacterium]|nr:ACT domain-containing protein [Candidatus Dormibacteraeota bacterium]